MPGRDGLSTLEGLRALPDCPPMVYVTGSEESRIAVAALKAGAQDYVVKAVGEDFFDLLAQSFARCWKRPHCAARATARRKTCAPAMPGSKRCCAKSTTAWPTTSRWSWPSFRCRRAAWTMPRA
jgi:FixJ family two-component response regulator